MRKEALIWLNILLLLGLLLVIFEKNFPRENIYEDDTLQHLGMSREDVIERYGAPDYVGSIGGPGGENLFYEDIKTLFIFAGDSDVVNNLELFPGKEFLGVEVGMTFDEIVNILGLPQARGYDFYMNDYTIVYHFGEEKDGMGELEIWFSAEYDGKPTRRAQVFWKKHWR